MRLAAVLAAAVALLAIATVAPRAPDALAQASCDPARPSSAGASTRTIRSGALDRRYELYVPAAYDGSAPTPVVLLLHGLGSTGERTIGYTGMAETAEEEGFIIVAPDGEPNSVLESRHWHFLLIEQLADPTVQDDLLFFNDLLDEIEATLCVDTSRVYSTGISNGAMMSVRLACNLSSRIAAIGPVAGAYFPPWSEDLAVEPPCADGRPVPLIAFHGTADEVVPFEGGPIGIQAGFVVRHIEREVLPAWASYNGCPGETSEAEVTEHVRLVRYTGCPGAADLELYVVEGGDHTWPGAVLDEDDIADEVSANDLVWAFFEAHPLGDRAAASTPQATATGGPTPEVSALPDTGDGDGRGVRVAVIVGVGAAAIASVGGIAFVRRRRQTPA